MNFGNTPESRNYTVDDLSYAMAALRPQMNIYNWPFQGGPGQLHSGELGRMLAAARMMGPRKPNPARELMRPSITGPIPGYTPYEVPVPTMYVNGR